MPFRNIKIGRNGMIGHDVFFQTGRESHIQIGDNVSLNTGTHVVAGEHVIIGDNVAVGEYVSIRDQDHNFKPETGVRDQGFHVAGITIGANCWIGRGVHISPGVTLGDGCIVAANAVVRDSFPPHTLIAGAPAVAKRKILPDGSTARLDSAGSIAE
ncbi:MAG: acyltransferase [Pseudomonadota bacterium]